MTAQPALGLVNGIKSTGKNYVNIRFKDTRLYILYSRSSLATHMTVYCSVWFFFLQAESSLKFIAFCLTLSLLHINFLSCFSYVKLQM